MDANCSKAETRLGTFTGNQDIVEGLLLVRATALKIVRLQLAIQRDDRRVALEAVDDLLALDRSLENFLTDVPVLKDHLVLRDFLSEERSALNSEKLTLAAGNCIQRRTKDADTLQSAVPLDSQTTDPNVLPGGADVADGATAFQPENEDPQRSLDEAGFGDQSNDDWDDEATATGGTRWWLLTLFFVAIGVAGVVFALNFFAVLPDLGLVR